MTERSVDIAVEADRIHREESEGVAPVLALLDVNNVMISHLLPSTVRDQNQHRRGKGFLIAKTIKERKSELLIYSHSLFSPLAVVTMIDLIFHACLHGLIFHSVLYAE